MNRNSMHFFYRHYSPFPSKKKRHRIKKRNNGNEKCTDFRFNIQIYYLLITFFSGMYTGSLCIAPRRNCTYFLKIGFVVAGGGFNSYYIHQGLLRKENCKKS